MIKKISLILVTILASTSSFAQSELMTSHQLQVDAGDIVRLLDRSRLSIQETVSIDSKHITRCAHAVELFNTCEDDYMAQKVTAAKIVIKEIVVTLSLRANSNLQKSEALLAINSSDSNLKVASETLKLNLNTLQAVAADLEWATNEIIHQRNSKSFSRIAADSILMKYISILEQTQNAPGTDGTRP